MTHVFSHTMFSREIQEKHKNNSALGEVEEIML